MVDSKSTQKNFVHIHRVFENNFDAFRLSNIIKQYDVNTITIIM